METGKRQAFKTGGDHDLMTLEDGRSYARGSSGIGQKLRTPVEFCANPLGAAWSDRDARFPSRLGSTAVRVGVAQPNSRISKEDWRASLPEENRSRSRREQTHIDLGHWEDTP